MKSFSCPWVVIVSLLVVGTAQAELPVAPDAASAEQSDHTNAVDQRLVQAVEFLASDKLEGRGVGTQGLDLAADYLAGRFEQLGLNTRLFDGSPFQRFKVTTNSELGLQANNRCTLVVADQAAKESSVELKLGEDFTPLAIGGSGTFDLPVAFVGYGITAKNENYDDYAGVDVKGKAVIVLRHEPQQDNPHSVFDGAADSHYAPISRKVSNAYEHGAAAVILCTDEVEIKKRVAEHFKRWQAAISDLAAANAEFSKLEKPALDQIEGHRERVEKLADQIKSHGQKLRAEYDPVYPFDRFGEGSEGRNFPVLQCRRATIDQALKAAGTDLAALERQIDEGPAPRSRDLTGWRVRGETKINRKEAEVKNVVAVLDGEGPLAEETIVIGAHYDHLGWGGAGSFVPEVKEIHNGADDNASGTAVLVEVAGRLARREKKLPRRVVFIAFTGEERGLLGSSRYVREPLFPIEQTVAMLNMDMVGRLKNDKLVVYGFDTATEFGPLLDQLNKDGGFQMTRQPGGFGPSDHAAFYAKRVPVLHFFTGSHEDYHRPSDDVAKVNVGGMRRVADLVESTAVALATAERRPEFVESKAKTFSGGGDRPYFGSVPDFTQDQPGYGLSAVTKDGPAERGGIRGGDIIVQLGESKIGNLEDFDSALRKHKAGDRVPVVIRRGDKELKLEVTLDPPK